MKPDRRPPSMHAQRRLRENQYACRYTMQNGARTYGDARYGGQSGMICTSREPQAEQTNRRDRASAMNGVSGGARIASKAILP